MGMGIENRIDVGNSLPQCLEAKLGSGIKKNDLVFRPADQGTGPAAMVFRIL
jgi:hypothetical protein